MTQTLTTERLKQIASGDAFICTQDDESVAMARELLANREAQPVVWVMIDDLTDKSIVSTPAYRSKEDAEERTIGQIAPLFTAPPAPAVPDESEAFEAWFASDYSPDASGKSSMGERVFKGVLWHVWKARAMLAQPVSQGKLPEWIACSERLPDTDGNYWGWWSESKRQGPVWFIKSDVQAQFQSSEITHWMPLPAAPEGGNG